jgi:hypothetical protein
MEIVRRDKDKQAVLLTFLKFCSRAEVGEGASGAVQNTSGIPEAVHAKKRAHPGGRARFFRTADLVRVRL